MLLVSVRNHRVRSSCSILPSKTSLVEELAVKYLIHHDFIRLQKQDSSLPATEKRSSFLCETSKLINNLERKILPRQDGLDIEPLNLKENIIQITYAENIIQILKEIKPNVTSNNIEACYGIGKIKNHSRKATVRFINQEYAKKALFNKKKLSNINKFFFGLSNIDIFVNEKLTPENHKVSFHCRQIKHCDRIEKSIQEMVWCKQ